MRKKNLAIFLSSSILTGIVSTLLISKRKAKLTNIENIYIGKYSFASPIMKRQQPHILIINDRLELSIDSILLEGRLESIDSSKLILLDKYGYRIVIESDGKTALSMLDEAEGNLVLLKKFS